MVQGSWFKVQGSGSRVQGSKFRVQGAGCRVQGSGFRVQNADLDAKVLERPHLDLRAVALVNVLPAVRV